MAATLLEATGRWLVYAPTLGLFGTIGLIVLLTPPFAAPSRHSLRRLGLAMATALLGAVALRALLQTINVFGVEELGLESLRRLAIDSRWGGRWRMQALAALAVLGATLLGLDHRHGRIATGLSLVGLAAVLPATGHAWGKGLVWTAQSLHVVGAGLWMGTLLLLTLLPDDRLRILEGGDEQPRGVRASLLQRFSRVAFFATALLFGSAAVMSLLTIPSLRALPSSAWGRLLTLKAVLALIALALGATNFLALRRGAAPSMVRVKTEAMLGIALVIATGFLTAVAPPGEH